MQNRIFFPQAALDQWIVDGSVDLQKGELTILGPVAQGRKFQLEEAVRVMREVSGEADAAKLIGRVKTRAWLESQGGEIVETSMLLGDTAYDVEPGWVGTPVGGFADYVSAARTGVVGPSGGSAILGSPAARRDEELLATFLSKHL